MSTATEAPSHRATLRLWDVVSLIVGIVIGTAIFKTPALVLSAAGGPWQSLALWGVGGLISLAGAFCYAELAAAFPRSGGDYEYLRQVFGRSIGLQFASAQLLAVLTGSLGSMAFAFADYAVRLAGSDPANDPRVVWLALGAIALLTACNAAGMIVGRGVQNVLTVAKLVGLVVIAVIGCLGNHWETLSLQKDSSFSNPGLALVLIMYAFSGWSHAGYVASEVREPSRNLPRALLWGIAVVTATYLVINVALLAALGESDLKASSAPAADAVARVAGPTTGGLVAVLVMLSALGAINGTILTGAHLFAELGTDYSVLRWMRRGRDGRGTPLQALLVQGVIAALMVVCVGTAAGRDMIDAASRSVGLSAVPWTSFDSGFDTLVAATSPLYWLFALVSVSALFTLRARGDNDQQRFRTPGFPITPLVFCGACGYMLWSSLTWAGPLSVISLGPLIVAVGISIGESWRDRRA
jgi:APA family basic amino acid/polyamine antiporter